MQPKPIEFSFKLDVKTELKPAFQETPALFIAF